MSANLTQIASQIVANLRVTDPELDTSVGSTTRKIIDAVAESIAEAYIDTHLIDYQYDIDAKVDADLDDFVQLFGMARLPAKRASGLVTFTRGGTASGASTATLPLHTQVSSNTTPPVAVQTVTSAFMEPGSRTVNVPVQAVEAGPAGNLPANSLVVIATPVQGVNKVTNVQPLSGGSAQETDTALRLRWKKTVFRSLAGTEQMYLGVALDDPDCYVANVIGSSKKRREQIQIIGGVGQTTVDDATYIFAEPVMVGRNIDGGDINLAGVDYAWDNTANPPRFNVLNATLMPNNEIFEVDFEYVPLASRNKPGSGITNRVDIWVGGTRAQAAVQSLVFRRSIVFSNTSTNPYYRQKFRRASGVVPTAANVFLPFAFGPVLTAPATISVQGVIYALADAAHPMGTTESIDGETVTYAYQVVHDTSAEGLTPYSAFGLEWHAGALPPDNAVFSVGADEENPYTYNDMIGSIQEAVDRWRLLGVDARVHQAKTTFLRLNVAIMYSLRANQPLTNQAIDTAVAAYMTAIGFQGRVQVSDLLQVIHNVEGVDNVRFLHGADHPGYLQVNANDFAVAIQQVVNGVVTGTFADSSGRPRDLRFGDNELPVFESCVKVIKAENSFGSA